jgi:ATP-dependent Zn protease
MSMKIERTAYHEAGHAVASYHLHVAFSYISITPDEDSWGRVKHPKLSNFKPEWDDSPREQIAQETYLLLAGQVRRESLPIGNSEIKDWQSVINLASYSAETTKSYQRRHYQGKGQGPI